ncbi:MAG: WD40 repeat domain-containing protein [Myxococcota bacterium]
MGFSDLPPAIAGQALAYLDAESGRWAQQTGRFTKDSYSTFTWRGQLLGQGGALVTDDQIHQLVHSPDIDSLIVLSGDEAKVLDLHTGKVRHVVGTNDQPARAVAPDGSAILTCSETGGNALLYSPAGQLLRTLPLSSIPRSPRAFALSAMQFKSDRESVGNWVLMDLCGPDTSYLWPPQGLQNPRSVEFITQTPPDPLQSTHDPMLNMTAPSPEHAVAIIMLRSGKTWSLTQSDGLRRNMSLNLGVRPTASAISPSGEFFAVGTQTGQLTLFPVGAVSPEEHREGPPQALADAQTRACAITSVAISSCDRFIVTGSEDGTARLWSLDVREEAARGWIPRGWVRSRAPVPVLRRRGCIRLPSPITAVAFCERGGFVAIGRSDGKLNLIHLGKEFRSTSGRNPLFAGGC